MRRYGHYKEDQGFPLAAWVWGHRLRIGQHWIEYMLEFLNVLAGFEYTLAEGITHGTDAPPNKQKYKKFTRLGLRRFVFYDEREKTRHPLDDRARDIILDTLQKEVIAPGSEEDPLKLISELFRSFACLEENRSWFAKSLFPAHHELLFFEALRKGATRYEGQDITENFKLQSLDNNIVFDSRNFFARGGEIYYLILSAGTNKDPHTRSLISERLHNLLCNSNPTLGVVAKIIDETWSHLLLTNDEPQSQEQYGTLGWIPDPECQFYRVIANDLASFLSIELEPLEQLDLLAYLINFHLTLYLYHRAHPHATASLHQNGSCLESCRLSLLIDILEGEDGGVVRQASATLYREQEARISQKAQNYISELINLWANEADTPQQVVSLLESRAVLHFNMSTPKKKLLRENSDPYLQKLGRGEISLETYLENFVQILTGIFMPDFRKNFLSVHRKLSKAIGFASPKTGVSARFTLSDNLLKVLILTNRKAGMTYIEFLDRLYKRYGLVIGISEAKTSGLYERLNINLEYYDRNQGALLERMKRAGLAHEYSDATAMISEGAS